MKYKVHMLAFEDKRGMVREVEVPEILTALDKSVESLLEMIFKYGQNDFQPLQCRSVSVGDVAEVNGKYWIVASVGWDLISKEEFEGLTLPTRMYGYTKK